jgi:hypothetical protein
MIPLLTGGGSGDVYDVGKVGKAVSDAIDQTGLADALAGQASTLIPETNMRLYSFTISVVHVQGHYKQINDSTLTYVPTSYRDSTAYEWREVNR